MPMLPHVLSALLHTEYTLPGAVCAGCSWGSVPPRNRIGLFPAMGVHPLSRTAGVLNPTALLCFSSQPPEGIPKAAAILSDHWLFVAPSGGVPLDCLFVKERCVEERRRVGLQEREVDLAVLLPVVDHAGPIRENDLRTWKRWL
ncbi:unnamed protein product [Cyprideis torosa]|uniref:Uncharacterized protein n=1 Tax=Cyprideis torosa TaxID=163714 RepID=A0A7R8WK33_9CRUS|nr:unnamed protein product [Cyprideis torosa]CAG0902634.1 unnamed protein product [Cyprideis torosa]